MAGGSGTRLWPLSRKNFPKQFLALAGNKSFIQLTADRLTHLTDPADIYVVAGREYKLTIADHLSRCLGCAFDNLILEPEGRNTAPAIALAMKYLAEKRGVPDDEPLFFSPSDHMIRPEGAFADAVRDAASHAADKIVTFGIIPTKPETGYGYIETGIPLHGETWNVARFVEKPDINTAKQYLSAGNYLWNSGMFLFTRGVMTEAFRACGAADLVRALEEWSYDEMVQNYAALQGISIDYAVMEKAKNIACRRLAVEWNDVGSWDSVYEIFPKDAEQNALSGDVITLNTRDSLVISGGKLTAVVGVSGIAVIETDDAILVSDRDTTQDVKEIVGILKKMKRPEADEHTTTYRPWGKYTVLEESERYKIKKITVNPGATLSLQKHKRRSEHWIVVKGTAQVRIGSEDHEVRENQSAYVPKGVEHRLGNAGAAPLEIIEVQNGDYVGEDDIERIEDVYGRAK